MPKNNQEHIMQLVSALKVVSEALELLDKRVKNNTDLICSIACIDINKMREDIEDK